MKHSIVFKFLAIVLCAASLLGIVGGAAGTLALVEGNLYKKDVDQMLDERLQASASALAEQAALSYASRELGGCPEDMVRRYGTDLNCEYGYSLLDAEGNVLTTVNPGLKNRAEVYEIPVTGQYMHLVSVETETERLARETAARMDSISRGLEDQAGQTVPVGGVPVNQVIFTDHQGAPLYEAYGDLTNCYSIFYYVDGGNTRGSSHYDHELQNQIGFLYYGANNQLMYRSFLEEWDHNVTAEEVCGVMFLSHESGFLFQTEDPEGLGILTFEDGHLCFTGYGAAEEAAEETLPEESIPETTVETLPPETVAETQAEETSVPSEETQPVTTEEYSEEAPAQESQAEASAEEHWEEESSEENWEESSASDVPEEEAYSDGEHTEEDYSGEEASDEHHSDEESNDENQAAETRQEETLPPETLPAETVVEETVAEETLPEETVAVTEPVLINGKPLEFYQVNRTEYVSRETGELTTAKYVYLPLPEMTVSVYVNRDSLDNAELYNVLRVLRLYRGYLLPLMGICLLLFALSAVYLCTTAGRDGKTGEIRASGLNRLPLDLYAGLGIFVGTGIAALAFHSTPMLLNSDILLGCSTAMAAAFFCCLIFTAFIYACMAQAKCPGGYWWRNLLCIRFVFLCMRFLQWLERWLRETCIPVLGRFLKKAWLLVWKVLVYLYEAVEKFTAQTGEKLNRFFSLIPMTWQWLLAGLAIILFSLLVNTHNIFLILIGILVPISIVLYATHCFGILSESAKQMGKGNLDTKVENKLMVGCFQDFANDLNDLADVAVVAAQKQLKSERMKTELITNVSHDIKTPLTSIINYVDLLQKPHNEEEEAQYLEVLDRQSQRLKKLVEDLMDMSKASTGNMAVEITRVDAVESVNQALGEFADKLERAQLHPVFRHSEDSVPIMADGKLVWRVLSNLLSNAVKYAMPGTRIYLDLTHVGGKVIISLKNISREELNVTAEELMERFVRGDVSRNTEGSGLGLNIAKSLMELQKGQLQLLVDGDLFKVTLIFPGI